MTIQELEQCISLYGKDIYSFCRYLTREKESADDLYQDTFLEAMKKLPRIKARDNPKSYLLSVALKLWKNRQRKAARRGRIVPVGGDDTQVENLSADGGDLSEQLVSEEERLLLWKAIGHLSDSYRLPLLLFYMEGQSVAEIARLLSLPQGTVKSRLYHARAQIKQELEEL